MKLNNELEFEAVFQKAKGAVNRIKDLSYQISRLEEKARNPESIEKITLLKFYLAITLDLKDILKDLDAYKKQYERISDKS